MSCTPPSRPVQFSVSHIIETQNKGSWPVTETTSISFHVWSTTLVFKSTLDWPNTSLSPLFSSITVLNLGWNKLVESSSLKKWIQATQKKRKTHLQSVKCRMVFSLIRFQSGHMVWAPCAHWCPESFRRAAPGKRAAFSLSFYLMFVSVCLSSRVKPKPQTLLCFNFLPFFYAARPASQYRACTRPVWKLTKDWNFCWAVNMLLSLCGMWRPWAGLSRRIWQGEAASLNQKKRKTHFSNSKVFFLSLCQLIPGKSAFSS